MFCPKDHLKDGCEIFTARRLVKKNGVEYLLKAMKLVLEEVECSLTIAGDGPERMRMEKLSEKLGISEKVHFLGLVPHQDIPRHLARADLAVIPSIVEASSLFLLEAMAMGKPVIASRVGDIPQILNGAGTLVEPMDERSLAREIVAVFKHGDKRMIGRKALEEVKKRSWRKVAKKIEEEYSRLCET
jgi:glycosyltransferase involved in cell wall biosynthesis